MQTKRAFSIHGLVLTGMVGCVLLSGCKDPDLAGQAIPAVSVSTVATPDGLTLDESAQPEEVVYAFLRAARVDVLAARSADGREDQQAAYTLQSQLAAANRIQQNLAQLQDRETLAVRNTRDEAVFKIVRYWTPTVAYYVDEFAGDRATLIGRMRTSYPSEGEARVLLDVAHADSRATVQFLLTREPDDEDPEKKYWRIYQVGFTDPRSQPTAVSLETAGTSRAHP